MAAKVIFLIFTILFVSNLYSQEIGIVSSKQWTDNSEIENPAGLGVYLYLPVSKVGVQFEYSTAWNERIVKGNISSGFMNPAQNTIPERIRNNSTQQSLEFGLVIPEILNYNSFAFNIGGGFSVDWFSGERNGLESGIKKQMYSENKLGVFYSLSISRSEIFNLPLELGILFKQKYLYGNVWVTDIYQPFKGDVYVHQLQLTLGYKF